MSSLDLDLCIELLRSGKLLSETQVRGLCARLKSQLLSEPNVVAVPTPVTVVGDIHGQYFDLLELFRIAGECPDVNFLFLGDYVDRGHYSVETISLLVCLKLRWWHRVTLLRGNHESRQVTQVYGFYSECVRKYGNAAVWKDFVDLFDHLSLSAVIDNSIFCVHGGLSPDLPDIDKVRLLNRFDEVPHEGPVADLMWSDPDIDTEGWSQSQRGAGYVFGPDVVKKFLKTNGLSHIVRSHQLCMEGYQLLFNDTFTTIWSAPNYCYRCGNIAAVMEVTDSLSRNYNKFMPAPDCERKSEDLETNRTVPNYFL